MKGEILETHLNIMQYSRTPPLTMTSGINIHLNEHLSVHYKLCKGGICGRVPVTDAQTEQHTVSDSLEIITYLHLSHVT